MTTHTQPKRKPGRPKGRRGPYTMTEAAKEQRRQAGRKSYKKRGRQAYQRIGRLGAEALWNRYRRLPHPANPGQYILQDRLTGRIVDKTADHNNPTPQAPTEAPF